jgi:hypothetical protein
MSNVIFWQQLDEKMVAQKGNRFFTFPEPLRLKARMDRLFRHTFAVNFDDAPLLEEGMNIHGATVIDTVNLELDTSAERIELTQQQADEHGIRVASEHTGFASAQPLNFTAKQVQALYRDVIATAKQHGVQVKYKHKTASRLRALQSEGQAALDLYQTRYDALVTQWQAKLQIGIYVGCVDDAALSALHSGQHTLDAMLYRSTPIGQLLDMKSRFEELLRRMPDYSAITV